MTRTLVTFLGRCKTLDGGRSEYETLEYVFSSGHASERKSIFSAALWEYLACQEDAPPDRMVVLGTHGSSWDALYAVGGMEGRSEEWNKKWLELGDVVENVDRDMVPEQLETVEEEVEKVLEGATDVECRIIGKAGNRPEQLAILESVSEHAPKESGVVLDITHGFRHFGAVAISSVLFLRQSRDIQIEDIYYANRFVPSDDPDRATVVKLDAVPELMKWSEALATFRNTGLLGDLPDLFDPRYPAVSKPLQELNFALMASRFGKAKSKASQAIGVLRGLDIDEGQNPLAHFVPDLVDELKVFTRGHLADRQLAMARRALKNGDFLRSALYFHESIISAAIGDDSDHYTGTDGPRTYRVYRDATYSFLKNDNSDRSRFVVAGKDFEQTYKDLRDFRNTVAHGNLPTRGANDAVHEAFENSIGCRELLKDAHHMADKLVWEFKNNGALHTQIDDYYPQFKKKRGL